MAAIETVSHGLVTGQRVGRYNLGINTTFVVYHFDSVFIDTGPSNQWQYVKHFAESQKPEHVLLTHHHEDHTGNAASLQSGLGLTIHANQACREIVQKSFDIPLGQKLIWGKAPAVDAQPIEQDFETNTGHRLQMLLTPGHTHDMSCFYSAEHGYLFTGDLYIASKVRYLHKKEDLQAQLDSLNKVLALDFGTAFCPHRGIMQKGKADITRKRDFIVELAEKVQDLSAKGISDAQITKRLLGRDGVFALVSGFNFSKRELITACKTLNTKKEKL